MATDSIQRVCIVGVGLLGGSLALALRKAFPGVVIAGAGRRASSLDQARQVGAIDEGHLDPAAAAARADLVVLATPVGAFETTLQAIRPVLAKRAVVTDVGSTKASVVRTGERVLGRGGPFVGSHPMAGTEKKGPLHATADLLAGALCIVTPTKHTPPKLARRVESLWQAVGMRTLQLSPSAHDQAVARISHLPHLASALLSLLPKLDDLPVAATGFRDMTRLASGDPEMWRDIVATNRRAILSALTKFETLSAKLRAAIEAEDDRAVMRLLQQAKARRDEHIGPACNVKE